MATTGEYRMGVSAKVALLDVQFVTQQEHVMVA
jgi:hypothetical protein